MRKNLVVTGSAGIGKTEAVKKALGDRLAYAGGLVTAAAADGNGLCLRPAYSLYDGSPAQEERFLWLSDGSIKRDNEVFRNTGVRLLAEAAEYPYILLDPICGYELVIPQFREALYSAFSAPVPILAVILDSETVDDERRLFSMGDRLTDHRKAFLSFLEKSGDTEIINAQEDEISELEAAISAWMNKYL